MTSFNKDFEGLSDSVVMLEGKPRKIITYMIYIILFIFVIFIIWATFSNKDEYVSAYGTIQSTQGSSKIISLNGGKIETIYVKNNQEVSIGDKLFEYDSDILKQELDIYNENLKTIQDKIEKFSLLKGNVRNNTNTFDSEDPFYAICEKYLSDIEIAKKSENDALLDLKQNKSEVNIQIKTLDDNQTIVQYKIDLYSKYKESLNSNKDMFSPNNDSIYQDYISLIKSIESASKENGDLLKTQKLIEIENALSELNANFESNKKTKTFYEEKLDAISNKYSGVDLSQYNLKQQILVEIDSKIETYTSNESDLKIKKIELENNIENAVVTANVKGVVMMGENINNGNYVNAGEEVLKIVPNHGNVVFKANIPESDIGSYELNDSVEIKLNSFLYTEYGKLSGKINDISPDVISDEKTGLSYYIVDIIIDQNSYGKIEKNDLKIGMRGEITYITQSKTVIKWLLEELNLWLNK